MHRYLYLKQFCFYGIFIQKDSQGLNTNNCVYLYSLFIHYLCLSVGLIKDNLFFWGGDLWLSSNTILRMYQNGFLKIRVNKEKTQVFCSVTLK